MCAHCLGNVGVKTVQSAEQQQDPARHRSKWSERCAGETAESGAPESTQIKHGADTFAEQHSDNDSDCPHANGSLRFLF